MAKNERGKKSKIQKEKENKNIVQRVENEWTELIMRVSRGEIIYKGEFLFPRENSRASKEEERKKLENEIGETRIFLFSFSTA